MPGGPRRPSTKPSLPNLPAPAQRQQQQQQQPYPQQQQQQPQLSPNGHLSDDAGPPSYMQSQQDSQAFPTMPHTPTLCESSSSQRTTSLSSRAGTPSNAAVLSSPVRTMSPAPAVMLESHAEEYQRSPVISSYGPSPSSTPAPEMRTARLLSSSKPLVPSTRSESPHVVRATTPSDTKSRLPATSTLTPLPTPPPPDFSSVPVVWKALPLEAAQWTFSSAELQAIVSRAIRASAEPSSIRLLPLQVLDREIADENARLEGERLATQAQYRFAMHRRTMLLQSLNAIACSPPAPAPGSSTPSPSSSAFPGRADTNANTINLTQNLTGSPVADIAHRIAEVNVTMDRLALTLLRISDQLAQLRTLQDVHAASALAVALRKLNASYTRRTRDLQALRERLAQAEEERDEAWRAAEELAREVDAEDDGDFEDLADEHVVNGERAVAVPATLTRASRFGIKLRIPGIGPRVRHSVSSGVDPPPSGGPHTAGHKRESRSSTSGNAPASSSSAPGVGGDVSTTVPRRRRAHSAASR
ncbi:hypothetical protein EW145_g7933, partial [Phellinidium pouzarii]